MSAVTIGLTVVAMILTCIFLVVVTIIIGQYMTIKTEKEAEVTLKTAQLAMDNESIKIKIHDAEIISPLRNQIRATLKDIAGDEISENEIKAYQKGFLDGVEQMKEKAKRISVGRY